MPVIVTASASQRLPKRPRTKSRRRDVVVLVADVPEPRKHQEQDRIDHDGVGHGEKREGAGAESERRNRDEGVGGVEIAADQKPGDERAEAPAAEAPFVQLVEIALAPMGGGKAQPGDETEQHNKDDERGPVHCRSRHYSPSILFFCSAWSRRIPKPARPSCVSGKIDDRGEHRADDDPEHLIPIEEWNAVPGGLERVIKRHPQRRR